VVQEAVYYHAMLTALKASLEGDAAWLECERLVELEGQLLATLAKQTERDQHLAQLSDKLALKSMLLEQAEANAMEAMKRAGLLEEGDACACAMGPHKCSGIAHCPQRPAMRTSRSTSCPNVASGAEGCRAHKCASATRRIATFSQSACV
jgi:hypothetical protein